MPISDARHPCFSPDARHQFGRVHLPVAPKCNIQCNYCNRSYDCVAESRPGVTSGVLEPWQAERYLDEVVAADPSIAVAGIAGPGDAFANPAETLETLRRIKAKHPEMLLCVATNGLALPAHVPELVGIGVSHVTVTVNAVDPEIGRGLYAWMRDGREILRGREGAARLWERQSAGIAALSAAGVQVKVNTIIVPGVNDHHVAAVAQAVAGLGAVYHNCMALVPVAGAEFADVPPPGEELMQRVRTAAAAHLPQMEHCSRCRADAVGRIGEAMDDQRFTVLQRHAAAVPAGRRHVAVASMEGTFVNQHLGEADMLLIYAPEGDGFKQIGLRRTPAAGSGSARWQELADQLDDCRALLVSGIGPAPTQILRASGLRVYETEGLIDHLLPRAFAGGEIQKMRKPFRCGDGCRGNAQGCA
jgi:nitrogen fixation protein NifB